MKLATLKAATPDGRLVVVSRDLTRMIEVPAIATTLQDAIERWSDVEPRLQASAKRLEQGDGLPFDTSQAAAPLPRAYQWLDASAFLNHGRLMAQAFGLAAGIHDDPTPLMYQGMSDGFLGAQDDIVLPSEAEDIDFEGEFAVIVDQVPMGTSARDAGAHVKLIALVNDVSLRAHVRSEMARGFGFLQAKPTSSFAPVVVTPDELGPAWREARVHLPLDVRWNDAWFGQPNGGEMSYGFDELIAYATRARTLGPGTIVGSGTVSNADRAAGSACIAERRVIEIIDGGAPTTAFMRFGDRVRMEAQDRDGQSVFGAIDQVVRGPR